jgi:hypothetical protein
VNLPVFETELVDGGLAVSQNQGAGDLIVAIGFAAAGTSRAETNGLQQYPFQVVRLTKPSEADYLYGYASNGSSISKAMHELIGGGANRVAGFNLGKWGEASFTDPDSLVSYDLFTAGVSGTYTINTDNYYRALNYAYSLLKDYTNVDILYPSDALAFTEVGEDGTDVSGRPTNFAYQLGHACYEMSTQNNEVDGVINVAPAASGTLQGVSAYVGTEPVKALDPITNTYYVVTDGTGLLGEPYMVGATSGTVGYSVLPGFFESNFAVGSEEYGLPPIAESEILEDRDGYAVDIGKYLSIASEEPIYSNGAYANIGIGRYTSGDELSGGTLNAALAVALNTGGAAAYAALTSSLPPHSAPTNKGISGVLGLRYKKSLRQLDLLDGGTPLGDASEGSNVKYVTFKIVNNAVTVTDAPTAALPSSSYARLSTHRIVKAVAKVTRDIATPFIGEPNSDAMRAALNTALEKAYRKMVGTALTSFKFEITASDLDKTLGTMRINLTLVPAFETRKIKFTVNLKSSL